MSNDKINHYAKVISEQVASNRISGMRTMEITEAAHGVPKAVTDFDPDATHVGSTKEGHHVYAHSETDRGESAGYSVKHPDGKLTHHSVDHGGETPSLKELGSKEDFHNVHDLHPSVRKIIHKDIKRELDY